MLIQPVVMLEDLTPEEEENAVTLFFDGYDTVLTVTYSNVLF